MSPKEISQVHAKTCQVFANPVRIEIIEALIETERTTEELSQLLGTSAPNISQHLKLMRDRGIIVSERREHKVLHSLSNRKLVKLFMLEREILTEILTGAASVVSEGCGEDAVNPKDKKVSA
jgi:DNA-binding transcriptional ArsR family regulator